MSENLSSNVESDPGFIAWQASLKNIPFPCGCGHIEVWRGTNRPYGKIVCSACGAMLKETDPRLHRRTKVPGAQINAAADAMLAPGLPCIPPLGMTVTAANRGAMSELLVGVDLMSRGIAVFRAIGPNCECDLVAIIGGQFLRIEVKTSRTQFLQERRRVGQGSRSRADVVAYVERGVAKYHPDITEVPSDATKS